MSSKFLVMRCTIPFFNVSVSWFTLAMCLFGTCDVLVYLGYVRNGILALCVDMLAYAQRKHERLYDGFCNIESQDMSQRGHIVSV
jgi:NADH:ubiquinone oxidoreductase subunit 6 (subunit J)